VPGICKSLARSREFDGALGPTWAKAARTAAQQASGGKETVHGGGMLLIKNNIPIQVRR